MTNRSSGSIEYSDQRGPERLEAILAADGDRVPREVRSRFEERIREFRARRCGQNTALDLNTTGGRVEYSEKLLAEIQAEHILEGI